jgi:gamma-glutamyltranspeptidase/glutathione hydrolase
MKKLLLTLIFFLVPVQALAAGGAVSAADPRAAAAGQAMLRQGGSAADAALAMMLALTVVEPQSSGIGGGGFFVYYDAVSGQPATIDGREKAPAATREDRFLQPNGQVMPFRTAFLGGHSVGVPGNIALAAKAHAKWGKLNWAKLFQPAIDLAEKAMSLPRVWQARLPKWRLSGARWTQPRPFIFKMAVQKLQAM